jgi:flagellar hook assembly protein FlgD
MKLYDLFGNELKKLEYPIGTNPGGVVGPNNVLWDGTDSDGNKVSFGMYILIMEATSGTETMKKKWKIGVIH